MSFITITEFDHLARDAQHQTAPMMVSGSIKAEQHIDLGLLPESSDEFQGRLICIWTPVPIALAFGLEPKADPGFHVRGAGEHWYGVNPGERLSVIMVS